MGAFKSSSGEVDYAVSESHLIRSLEHDLGEKLLLRDTRAVTRHLPGRCSMRMPGKPESLSADRRGPLFPDHTGEGTLSIVSTRMIAASLLPEVIYSFSRAHQCPDRHQHCPDEQVIRTIGDSMPMWIL
jgi:DNA-binding transcriptional LysR family regulator